MRDDYKHPVREVLRSLWFLPTVFVITAMFAGYRLSRVDISNDSVLAPILFKGDAAGARELLTVVSGTMITVTGLVFVLTVVALQIASSQFSPRLLRSFLQDPGTRLVLGVFVATFAYSLAGLFEVGQGIDNGGEFVPQLAVTGSLLLALLSVGMLVYYIQHITNSIRIDAVMVGVRRSTLAAVDAHYPHRLGAEQDARKPPQPPEHATTVKVSRSGYLQEVDIERLVRFAREIKGTVRIRPQVGHHLVAGAALGWVWSTDGERIDPEATTALVNRAVALTVERRVEDDAAFGVRQLVDVALRATAPSINDPYTAVQAIQHLSIIVARLAGRSSEDIQIADGDEIRLHVPVPGFSLLLDTICLNIRRSAANRPRVMVALLRLLETAAAADTSPARRIDIGRQIDRIIDDSQLKIRQPADLEPVRAMAELATFAAEHGYVE